MWIVNCLHLWCSNYVRKYDYNCCTFNISTTPNTTKSFTLFKLIQQSNMVTLSCLPKKNKFEPEEKSSVYWRFFLSFWHENLTFINKLNFFFFGFKSQFFFMRHLKVIILNHCISLNSVHNFLVVLGVVDMWYLLLNKLA